MLASASDAAADHDLDWPNSPAINLMLGVDVARTPRLVWGLEFRVPVEDVGLNWFVRAELHNASARFVAGARQYPVYAPDEVNQPRLGLELGLAAGGLLSDPYAGAVASVSYGMQYGWGGAQVFVPWRRPREGAELAVVAGLPLLHQTGGGRPLYLGGRCQLPRLVGAARRAVDPAVGAYFAAAAQHEYSSVWTFLRLAAELRAVGAPTDLIEAALDAADDEVRHAEACAQAAGGISLAPLPATAAAPRFVVPSTGALQMLAREAWQEGCLGEGAAAREAAGAAEDADEDRAAMLAQIARDEATHAELSWRVLAWAASRGATLPTGEGSMDLPHTGATSRREIAAGVSRREVRRRAAIDATAVAQQRLAALRAA